MKLLLTSTGLENKNIEKKFIELVDKDMKEVKVLFIPTAAIFVDAIEVLPKCINDLLKVGIIKENIIVYDLYKNISSDKLKEIDVVYLAGGDPQYLLERINEVKFNEFLNDFVDRNGIFVGVSAGSIIVANNFSNNLGYINCKLYVHCEKGSENGRLDMSKQPVVLLNNNQAILVEDNKVEIIE